MATTDTQVLTDLLLGTLLSRKYRTSDALDDIKYLISLGARANCLDFNNTPLIARVLSSTTKAYESGFFSRHNNRDSRVFLNYLQEQGANLALRLDNKQTLLHHLFSNARHFLLIKTRFLNAYDVVFGDEIVSLCVYLHAQGLRLDEADDNGITPFSLLIKALSKTVSQSFKNLTTCPYLSYYHSIKKLLKLVKTCPSHINDIPLLDYVEPFDPRLAHLLSQVPQAQTVSKVPPPLAIDEPFYTRRKTSQGIKNIDRKDYKKAYLELTKQSLLKEIKRRRQGCNNFNTITKALKTLAPSPIHGFIVAQTLIDTTNPSPTLNWLREFFMEDYGLESIEESHTPTLDYLKLLTRLGADLTLKSPRGNTLLHTLFRKKSNEAKLFNNTANFCITKYLWVEGKEKCLINFSQETLEISLYLMSMGLSLDDENNFGDTPLDLLLDTMSVAMSAFQNNARQWTCQRVVPLYSHQLKKILTSSARLPHTIKDMPTLDYAHRIDPMLGKYLMKEMMRRLAQELSPDQIGDELGIDVEPKPMEIVTIAY